MMFGSHTAISTKTSWTPGLACRSRLVWLVALAAGSINSALAGWNTAAETIEQHPTFIFTPSNAMPNGKHPLLVVLHGCAQSHTDFKISGNLESTAEANGIIVAVPFVGSEFFGTPQQKCWDYNGANDAKGHIAELVRLTNTLKARPALNIDPNHVYIVGLSSGAAMALAVGCKAPDVFAGIGAVAGPSVGSSQHNALVDASGVPVDNVSTAVNKCTSLAGSKASHFATQITNIAYGDMDKNGPKAMFDFSPLDTSHAGQLRIVSIKWSQDNIKVLQDIYDTDALGPEEPVQNGLGTHQVAKKDGRLRLSLLVAHNVGHAWPAGTGLPNSASRGGQFMAQTGLNYPEYVVDWLIANNMRPPSNGESPDVTLNGSGSDTAVTLTGTAKDPDGSVARVDTALLKAGDAGAFQQMDSHLSVSLDASGNYSDSFSGLTPGWYKARVTAVDNAGNATSQITSEINVGDPQPLTPCRDITDNNFNHVFKGRATVCNFGFTCARGSGDNLGLFNVAITSNVIEVSPTFFRKGICPMQ
jgi:poly(3-hydroxybutyrate) depolymerase